MCEASRCSLIFSSTRNRLGANEGESPRRSGLDFGQYELVIPVGHQYGMFAKYGVDLEPIYMGGGMNSLAAVTSNTVQFLSAGSTATISARWAASISHAVPFSRTNWIIPFSPHPEIKSPQDLKGKIVTGTRPGASADSALRLYLRRAGLVPDKDVIFISVGDSQQGRMNALHRGSVSATVLSPPFSGMAKQFGLRELADLRKSISNTPAAPSPAWGITSRASRSWWRIFSKAISSR